MKQIQVIAISAALCAAGLFSPVTGSGQVAADAPQTTQRARREVVMPPGFQLIDEAGRRVLAAEADAQWVREVLIATEPTTRPSTMPVDLVELVIERRAKLVEQMSADLLIAPADVEAFVDGTLLPAMQKLDGFEPPLIFLATDRQTLKTLVKGGWSDPRFQYNRLADEVLTNAQLDLPADGPIDDTLLPAVYEPSDDAATRRDTLRQTIQAAEGGIGAELSTRAQLSLQFELVRFIEQQLRAKVELSADQVWFRLGLTGALGARYASLVSGAAERQFVVAMVAEPRNVRLRARSIDLLNPTPITDLRPEYVEPYLDAMRRKSIAAVYDWSTRAPADAIPGVLAAIVEAKPKDGAALVAIIEERTGLDLTKDLKPG